MANDRGKSGAQSGLMRISTLNLTPSTEYLRSASSRAPPSSDAPRSRPAWDSAPGGGVGRVFGYGSRVTEFAQPLREQDVASDPFEQFARWFAEAGEAVIRAPEAAAVATATPDGAPSLRMVLVKQTSEPAFVFFSNYDSRKGRELAANPRAALLFHWDALGRQVRLEGVVERLAAAASAEYVRSRPRGSQLSALASHQSRPVVDRETLEARVEELAACYAGRELPVPDFWGGYRLLPDSFEFWQHREDRLHDRLLYTRADPPPGWKLVRLAP